MCLAGVVCDVLCSYPLRWSVVNHALIVAVYTGPLLRVCVSVLCLGYYKGPWTTRVELVVPYCLTEGCRR